MGENENDQQLLIMWHNSLWNKIRMNRNNFKIDSGGKCSVEICCDEKWKSFDMVSTCDFGILAISWNILWGLSLCCSESFKWNIKIVCSTHRDLTSYNAWTNRTKMRTVFENNQINNNDQDENNQAIFLEAQTTFWQKFAKSVGPCWEHAYESFIGKRKMCK